MEMLLVALLLMALLVALWIVTPGAEAPRALLQVRPIQEQRRR